VESWLPDCEYKEQVKRMRLLSGFALVGVLSAGVHAQTLESVLGALDRSAAKFRSISAEMKRVSHTAVINEDNVDKGTMLLKRANPRDMRMLVDLTEPDPKTVALSGKKLEIYYPKMKTVQEYDLGKQRAMLDQFFLIGFGTSGKELSESYNIILLGTDTIGEQKAARLELIPKSKEVLQHLKKLELWVSESTGQPVQQKFYLPANDYMLVTYSNLKANPDISDNALKLNLPKGVKREYPQKS
jgi:outer membrane lipoprotein-sorting protein